MDSSNAGKTSKSENLTDECEDNKARSEAPKTIEPLTINEPVISPAKRKPELTVKDDTKRRRSTESTRKDFDDNLADQQNVKDVTSIIGHSKKSQQFLPMDILCIEDNAKDRKTFKKDDSSLLQDAALTDINAAKSETHMLSTTKFSDNIKESKKEQIRVIQLDESTDKKVNIQITIKPDLNIDVLQTERVHLSLSDEFIRTKSNSSNKLSLKNISTSSTCDHLDSLDNLKTKEIGTKSVTYDHSTSKSKRIQPRSSVIIDHYNMKQSRIIDDFRTKTPEIDSKEHSRLQNINKTFQKYEKKMAPDSQIVSPAKRKSELTAVDEIKRRRGSSGEKCNKKNLINTFNVSDTVLSLSPFKISSEITVNAVSCTESIKKETSEKHDKMTKHVHESNSKGNTSEPENKTVSKMHAIQTNTPSSTAQNFGQFEGLAARFMVKERKSVSLSKSLHSSDAFNQPKSNPSKEFLEYPAVIPTNNSPACSSRTTAEEMIDQKSTFSTDKSKTGSNRSDTKTENTKEHHLSGYPINKMFRSMINKELLKKSNNDSLETSESSEKKPEDIDISKSLQEEFLTSQDNNPHSTLPNEESCSSSSRTSERKTKKVLTHPLYLERESKFIPVEQYENDPEIVESQKRILESFEQKSAQKQKPNLEPKRRPESNFLFKGHGLERDFKPRNALEFFLENHSLTLVLYLLRIDPDAFENSSHLERLIEEVYAKFWDFICRAASVVRRWIMLENNESPSDLNENEEFPDIMLTDEENKSLKSMPEIHEILLNNSPKLLPDTYEVNSPKSPPPENENLVFPDLVPFDGNFIPPILSPLKNETDQISEMDYPKFKEYPGLAEEPTKVKKDARYQKRFYRHKPIKLPVNWDAGSSSTEPDININSEDNEIEIIENDPRIFLNYENRKNEDEKLDVLSKDKERKCQVDVKDLLKDNCAHEDGKSRKNAVPETLQYAEGYKISSFMEESPTSPTGSSKSNKSDCPEKKDSPPE